ALLAATPDVFMACSDKDDPIEIIDNDIRTNLKGEVKDGENLVLESSTYKLTGPLIVNAGGKLTIKPGVIVEATPFSDGEEIRYIAVAQGGQKLADGTKERSEEHTSELQSR